MTPQRQRSDAVFVALGLFMVLAFHLSTWRASEPFFLYDEMPHVMTGVLLRDVISDLPLSDPKGYVLSHYAQYPETGLLIWPPLFYVLEGLLMRVFSISVDVGRGLVLAFLGVACAYTYFLVRRVRPAWQAVSAMLLFAFAPEIVTYSRHVMLEVPAIAWFLMALYHFLRYLDEGRRSQLFLAAAGIAGASLTRFDAAYVVIILGLFLLIHRGWRGFLDRRLIAVGLVTALVVGVVWTPTLLWIGHVHAANIGTASTQAQTGERLRDLFFYIGCLPGQVGWFILPAALLGVAGLANRERRSHVLTLTCVVVVTYVVFSAISEKLSRHTLYWVPALSALASEGLGIAFGTLRLTPWARMTGPALAAAVVGGTLWSGFQVPPQYVEGYAEAAGYVLAHGGKSKLILCDTSLAGNFVFQMRRQDPDGKMWVVRGDKVFWRAGPNSREKTYYATESGVMQWLADNGPRFIVVEAPPVALVREGDDALRRVLGENTDRFELEKRFLVRSNHPRFRDSTLLVYRNHGERERPIRPLILDSGKLGQQIPLNLDKKR